MTKNCHGKYNNILYETHTKDMTFINNNPKIFKFLKILRIDYLLFSINFEIFFLRHKERSYLCIMIYDRAHISVYKLCFMLCMVALFSSCSKKYKIEGASSVSLLDGKMLFIKVLSGNELVTIDSAEVVHGLFKMKGTLDSTMFASLYMDDECIMPLVVEGGNIDIQIDNARINVAGTPLNDAFYEFIMKKTSLDDRAYEVERLESRMIMDGKDLQTIQLEVDKQRRILSDEMNELAKAFIQENYDNVLGTGVFIMLCNSMPYPILTPMLQEVVDDAPSTFLNHPLIKELLMVAAENRKQMMSNSDEYSAKAN